MKFISHLTPAPRTYTFTQILKFTGVIVAIGMVLGIYVQTTVTPKLTDTYLSIKKSFASEITYTAPVVNVNEDRVETYYQEEYTKLESKYEQKRKDEAMLNALDKVSAELESSKEEIRERELFI